MSQKLDWIYFLNEACTWEEKSQAESFLFSIIDAQINLSDAEVGELSRAEAYMRKQLNSLHFSKEVDPLYLNERLAGMKLRLAHGVLESQEPGCLPALAPFSADKSALNNLIDTLLFQFAVFLGQTMDGAATYKVSRCEAICRKKAVEDCTAFYQKFRTLEESWKHEVTQQMANLDEVERCADFFVSSHGGKFCSHSCRFNSFALRKQMQDPTYQAEKQKRYRSRKSIK
jgi:hypothetical protein